MAYVPKIDAMIEARDDSRGELTCGIELEMLIPALKKDESDPDPHMKNQKLYPTNDTIREFIGYHVKDLLCEDIQVLDIPFRNDSDDYLHPPHDLIKVYDEWRVTNDTTLMKDGLEKEDFPPYQWAGIEVTSMVMEQEEYAQQITNVCTFLRGIRIHFNHTTGIHVHIGLGDEPFSLLTFKKFVTLYWFTESGIMDLHHPTRREDPYCFRLTRFSKLAFRSRASLTEEFGQLDEDGLDLMDQWVPDLEALNINSKIVHQIRRIWGTKDMITLAKILQGATDRVASTRAASTRGAIGFDRFIPPWDVGGNLQTFEWRQMAGTLDHNLINTWVAFCLAFTDYCRLTPADDFKAFIEKLAKNKNGLPGADLFHHLEVDPKPFQVMVRKWAREPDYFTGQSGEELFFPMMEGDKRVPDTA